MLFRFKKSLHWDESIDRYSIEPDNLPVKVHPLTGQLCIEYNGLLLPASWLELDKPEMNELSELQAICDEVFKFPVLFLDLKLDYGNTIPAIFLYAGEDPNNVLEDIYNAAVRMLFFTFLMEASEESTFPVYVCTQKDDAFELFQGGERIFSTIHFENILSKFNELSKIEGVC